MGRRLMNKRLPDVKSTASVSEVDVQVSPWDTPCSAPFDAPCQSMTLPMRHDALVKLTSAEIEEVETQADSVRSVTSSEDCFGADEISERIKVNDYDRVTLNNDEGRIRGQDILNLLHASKGDPLDCQQHNHEHDTMKAMQSGRWRGAPTLLQRTSRPHAQESVAAHSQWQEDRSVLREERFAAWTQNMKTDSARHCFPEDTMPQRQPTGIPQTKSKLRSSASLFVPLGSVPADTPSSKPRFVMPDDMEHRPAQNAVPYTMPQGPNPKSGNMPVRCIIEGAFGSRLCSLAMTEQESVTEVNVVVSENAYPTGTSWALDPLAQQRAMHVLLEAFKVLGSKLKSLEPSADETQLTLRYSEVPSDTLCWEYAKIGFCPRAACRWVHAVLEVFLINIVLQPYVPSVQCTLLTPVANSPPPPPPPMHFYFVQADGAEACMMPSMPCSTENDAAPPASVPEEDVRAVNSTEEANIAPPGRDPDPDPGSCPVRRDRICWADIEDDEDAT